MRQIKLKDERHYLGEKKDYLTCHHFNWVGENPPSNFLNKPIMVSESTPKITIGIGHPHHKQLKNIFNFDKSSKKTRFDVMNRFLKRVYFTKQLQAIKLNKYGKD